MRIYKYELQITDHQTVRMPPLSSVLKVAFQDDKLFAWATVNELIEPSIDVDFWISGTGGPIPEMKCDANYIDTVFKGGGVWHVFSGPCYD